MAGLETLILTLREAGFTLILLWLLTLSIVYGLLSHAGMPKSVGVRSVISVVSAFLVLFAAAASPAVDFIQGLVVASILIAFGLLLIIIFLEVGQIKGEGGKHILQTHPMFFGGLILLIFVGVFVGMGGVELLGIGIPEVRLTDTLMSVGLFVMVMLAAVWFMFKETAGAKKKD